MVKFFEQSYTIRHPWRTATSAFWRKYPNPLCPHVLQVDSFARSLCARTGRLTVNRFVCVQSTAPAWVPGPRMNYAVEETIVDPEAKSMVVKSRNVTGSSLLLVEETCTYAAHPERKDWTTYTQTAQIRAWVPLISSKLEGYTVESMGKKSKEGVRAVEMLCDRAKAEGVHALSSLMGNLSSFGAGAQAAVAGITAAAQAAATEARTVHAPALVTAVANVAATAESDTATS